MPNTNRQRDANESRHTHRVGRSKATAKKGPIDWKTWWPFDRATGDALKQLNKRQPKVTEPCEDAPF